MNPKQTTEFKNNEGEIKAIETQVLGGGGQEKLTLEKQVEKEGAETAKAQDAAREKEVKKLAMDQAQDNVQVIETGNIALIGNQDFFDKIFAEYYGCTRPGFDSLFTDARFPQKNGSPVVVSRCYHYPIKGKYLLLDILDGDEYTPEEIIENKAVFNALGFLYTWVVKGEKDISLADIFEKRLNAEVPKVKVKKLRQDNVQFAETK